MLWNFCLPRSYWQNFSLNRSLSVPGQKEKDKDGAQNNFPYSTGQGELWNASLCRQRDVFYSKIKKLGGLGGDMTCFPTNTETSWGVVYTDKKCLNTALLLASLVEFPVFHKLISKRFWPLLFPTMSALPSAAEAACEYNRAAAVGQFSIQQPWLCVFWR